MVTLILGFGAGMFVGLVSGRFFCKWHHKNDEANTSCCEQRPFTIGEQLEGQDGGSGCCGQEGCDGK